MTIFEHLILEDENVKFLDFRRISKAHLTSSRTLRGDINHGCPTVLFSFRMTPDVQRLILGKGEPVYELEVMACNEVGSGGMLMDDPDTVTESAPPMLFMIARGEIHKGMNGLTAYNNAHEIPAEILDKYWDSDRYRYYSSSEVHMELPKWMIDRAVDKPSTRA